MSFEKIYHSFCEFGRVVLCRLWSAFKAGNMLVIPGAFDFEILGELLTVGHNAPWFEHWFARTWVNDTNLTSVDSAFEVFNTEFDEGWNELPAGGGQGVLEDSDATHALDIVEKSNDIFNHRFDCLAFNLEVTNLLLRFLVQVLNSTVGSACW